jgi:hypothetical protein
MSNLYAAGHHSLSFALTILSLLLINGCTLETNCLMGSSLVAGERLTTTVLQYMVVITSSRVASVI